jgi:hypothetical protein
MMKMSNPYHYKKRIIYSEKNRNTREMKRAHEEDIEQPTTKRMKIVPSVVEEWTTKLHYSYHPVVILSQFHEYNELYELILTEGGKICECYIVDKNIFPKQVKWNSVICLKATSMTNKRLVINEFEVLASLVSDDSINEKSNWNISDYASIDDSIWRYNILDYLNIGDYKSLLLSCQNMHVHVQYNNHFRFLRLKMFNVNNHSWRSIPEELLPSMNYLLDASKSKLFERFIMHDTKRYHHLSKKYGTVLLSLVDGFDLDDSPDWFEPERSELRDILFYLHSERPLDDTIEKYIVQNKQYLKGVCGVFEAIQHKLSSDSILRANKKIILILVSVNGYFLKFITEFRSDRDVVIAAVSSSPCSLEYAADNFQDDLDIVNLAISGSGAALQYASPRLKSRVDLVLKSLVNNNGHILKYLPDQIRKDKALALIAIENGLDYYFLDEELKSDRNICLEYVKKKGAVGFGNLINAFKSDKEICLEAIRNTDQYEEQIWASDYEDYHEIEGSVDNTALQFASEELNNDREVVLEAVKQNGTALCWASEELRSDREIVFEAVKRYGSVLQYASIELRNDREIVLTAVKIFSYSLRFASPLLQNDKEIVKAALLSAGTDKRHILRYTSEEIRQDEEIIAMLKDEE